MGGGGGGGGVGGKRVWFLRPFGLKTGMDQFWSGIRYGFQGNYGSV